MLRRIVAAILFIPMVFASVLIQPIVWIFTGKLGYPWLKDLLDWANYYKND